MSDPEITYTCRVWAEELGKGSFVIRTSVIQSQRRRCTLLLLTG